MEKIVHQMNSKEIEQLIEALGNTEADQNTALLLQAKQVIEQQQTDLIRWEAQSFEVRSHLGQVLNSVFVLICSNLEEFDWICDMESGTPSEESVKFRGD